MQNAAETRKLYAKYNNYTQKFKFYNTTQNTNFIKFQASTTLSLDLCPEFMRDGCGAGLISISHFTPIFANFIWYKC